MANKSDLDNDDLQLLEVGRIARARGIDPVARLTADIAVEDLRSEDAEAEDPGVEKPPSQRWVNQVLIDLYRSPKIGEEKLLARVSQELAKAGHDISEWAGTELRERIQAACARFPGGGRKKGSRNQRSRRRPDVAESVRQVDAEIARLHRLRPDMSLNDLEDCATEKVARRQKLNPETLRKRLDRTPLEHRRKN